MRYDDSGNEVESYCRDREASEANRGEEQMQPGASHRET